ncbi:MAG: winged helix-turn-helix domain-containing protein, partial [Clostridia bacterium]|nr:winged helix-turn-helix domain-containing protein [Clostridia bacterium]
MSSDKEGSNVCLQVNMLGGFHILVNGKPLFSQAERSRQVMNLLAYLLLNRRSLASQQKLIEVLWPDDNSGDPTNALKNLVYRLRKALSRNDALSQFECVLLQNGHYIWNNKIPCRIDTELMEDYWKQACNLALGIPERIDLCSRALSLYKGRFLPDIEHGSWTVSLSSYYQNIYMSCVREAIRLLSLEQRFDEIFAICQTAIALEPYEELLHENLIKALIQMGKRQKALQHYHDI